MFEFAPTAAAADGVFNITNFDVAHDVLVIDLPTIPAGVNSLDDLIGLANGVAGSISANANPFSGQMVVIFGNDVVTGAPIELDIAGVSNAANVVVEIV
jgi:hypothetical protein